MRHVAWIGLVVFGACVKSDTSPTPPAVTEASSNSPVPAQPPAQPSATEGPVAPPADTLSNLWTRKMGVDWETFLGPTGDSKSSETGFVAPWPKEGPRIVWQAELGTSYGIGAVSRGRYFQFDRHDDQARLTCFHAETGKELWRWEYPTAYEDYYGYNNGPRCSPLIDGDRVYLFGAEGILHCLRIREDGADVVWSVDTEKQFGVVQNFFGVGSTPAIEGNLLIVMIGGSPPDARGTGPNRLDTVQGHSSGIVAFDKLTGQVRYRITDELASYASMKLATIGDRRWGFAFCRGGLVGFEPTQGQVDFHYPWRAKILESVNASVPVVHGNEVFISETYRVGSSLLRVRPGAHEVVWADDENRRAKAFLAHWNTPVYVDGYLYGCSGRNEPDAELRCIRWDSGKVQWSIVDEPQARSSLLYVDGYFVGLTELGKLQLFRPNPEKFELVSEVIYRRAAGPAAAEDRSDLDADALPGKLLRAPCWAAPILSHGLLYVRGKSRLLCLEVIPET